MGKEKYPAHFSHAVPSKMGGKNLEKRVKFTAQGQRRPKRLIPNHRTTECSSSPTTYHHIIKALLQRVLLPGTSCPPIKRKKKIRKHTKRQKHNLKFKSIRTRYSRMLELSAQEFETTMVNILKVLIDRIE